MPPTGSTSQNQGYLYAINPDGTLKWRFETNGVVFCSPTVSPEGKIYFGSYDDTYYILSPEGEELYNFGALDRIYSSTAITPDGTLYFGSMDNYLYILGEFSWDEESVNIYSNYDSYKDGDALEIRVNVQMPYYGVLDLYTALEMDGRFYWFPDWGTAPQAMPISYAITDGTILMYNVSRKDPSASYTFYSAITEYGTTNVLDMDSVTIKIN